MKSLAMLALSVFFMGAAPDSTPTVYTIQDISTQSLGLVSLKSADQQVNTCINIPGTYPETLEGQATSIVIQGQEIDYPNTGTINLPNGKAVQVTWVIGTNAILVVDTNED
jgi:hypothetical protein